MLARLSLASQGASGFSRRVTRYPVPISSDTVQKQIALLRILVGCGDKALEAFQAADNPLDTEFVTDLERIIQRSRDELAVLVENARATA